MELPKLFRPCDACPSSHVFQTLRSRCANITLVISSPRKKWTNIFGKAAAGKTPEDPTTKRCLPPTLVISCSKRWAGKKVRVEPCYDVLRLILMSSLVVLVFVLPPVSRSIPSPVLSFTLGTGLGARGTGIDAPISAGSVKNNTLGVGADIPHGTSANDDEFALYKKRMMAAYRHRPNPLNNPRRAYY